MSFQFMKNQKGFSITEVLVAMGLSSILILMTVGFQLDMKKNVQNMENRTDFIMDSNVGIQAVWKLLGQMRPSLNNLNLLDDNGRNFFDTIAELNLSGAGNVVMSREFTLDAAHLASGRAEFYFLVDAAERGTPVLYNPVHAYDGEKLFNSAIEYVGLNQSNVVTDKLQGSGEAGKIMDADELVLMQSPVFLKDASLVTDASFVNDAVVFALSRQLSFLGAVNRAESDLRKESYELNFNYSHPAFPSLVMRNVDDFLRYLPPSLGGGAYAVVSPVKMVKINAQAVEGDTTGKLIDVYLSYRQKKKFTKPLKIFSKVSSVKLIRKDISTPVINLEVKNENEEEVAE